MFVTLRRPLAPPVSLYQPGTSLMHRTPPGIKVVVLASASVLVVSTHDLVLSGVVLLTAQLTSMAAKMSLRLVAGGLRGILLVAALSGGLQWWQAGPARATETLLDLVAVSFLAALVSASTPANELLDLFLRLAAPLRFIGLDRERVALTTALALQGVPATVSLAVETRDAARARGVSSPRAFLAPFVVRVVARAQETGDALTARGLLLPPDPVVRLCHALPASGHDPAHVRRLGAPVSTGREHRRGEI